MGLLKSYIRRINMYEYKVVEYDIKMFSPTQEIETAMNNMARQGWKVVSTTTRRDENIFFTRLIVTYEREKK